MSKKSTSQEYASAVYALALEGWQKDLQTVQDKLTPDLLAKLANTATSFADRQKVLDKALPKGLSNQATNFLYTLLKNGDIGLLGEVATNLTRLATKGPGLEVATVTTAIALNEKEKKQFQAKLSGQYGDHVDVDFVVDESIVGGVIVQVGDKIIDGSVASKLDAAKQSLSRA